MIWTHDADSFRAATTASKQDQEKFEDFEKALFLYDISICTLPLALAMLLFPPPHLTPWRSHFLGSGLLSMVLA